MLERLRQWRDRRIIRSSPIGTADWRATLAARPILGRLDATASDRLRDLVILFLERKTFLPVQGLELTPADRRLIAAQACLPLLNLGFDWYDDWLTVIIYPGRFLRPRQALDAAGVMHEWTDVLRGEAWHRGPVVLSWADVAGSGHGDGYNVILHEMAHQIDLRNGSADGFPPLHPAMRADAWRRSFSAAFAELNTAFERGEPTPIDPYAGESPAEFFAVVTEYFFERPDLLWRYYPAVYRQLGEFYRQNPLMTGAHGDT